MGIGNGELAVIINIVQQHLKLSGKQLELKPVSYTHLTLPTILLV